MACLSCWHTAAPSLSAFAEPGVRARYAPPRTARIEHIDLTLHLYVAEERFEGRAEITLTPTPTYNGVVVLDCDEIDVESVREPNGDPLQWESIDGTLRVTHPTCPTRIVVEWTGQHPRHGLYFTGPTEAFPQRPRTAWTQCQDEDAHFVLPCHDHPRSRHGWTIHLTGPKGHTLLSNGQRVREWEEDGRAHATFEQAEPMPAYLLTAVCAPLDVIETEHEGLSVRYLFPTGEGESARRAMGRTPQMIALFAERTATPFPWARYDQVVVHDFVFGGMENVGCTTMTDLLLVSEAAALEWDPETLVAHELAHQWFGDLVTCIDWSHGWLNESWATFLETVWIDATRAEDEATWYRYTLATAYFAEANTRYKRPIVEARYREPIDVFDRHLYQKGASVLSTLRFRLGEDAFWEGVRLYLTRHAHGSVHTVHFLKAMEDATGDSLAGFFDEWIHTAGHPVVNVRLERNDEHTLVHVEQTQDAATSRDVFTFDLVLHAVGHDGQIHEHTARIDARSRTLVLPFGGLRTVRVDPGMRFLGEVSLSAPREWLEALVMDDCPVLSVRAASALLKKGHPKGIGAVHRAAQKHPSRFAREDLVTQLAKRDGSATEAFLREVVTNEPDPRVRRAAVQGLGRYPTATSASALRSVVGSVVETPHLLGAALKALGETRQPGVEDELGPHVTTRSWAEVVASRALAGLAATRRETVLNALLDASEQHHPPRVRAAALGALAALAQHVPSASTPARERLLAVLREGEFRTSLAAIAALKELGDARAIGALDDVHASAADGRVMRMAFEAARSLRTQGRGLTVANQASEDAAQLKREHAELRQRLEVLEGRV